jgi:hypothetical protein
MGWHQMGGLILVTCLAIWGVACITLAAWLVNRARLKRFKTAVSILLALTIFILPVADELAARPGFEALCREGAVLKINPEKIKGRTVRLDISPTNRLLEGRSIPILHSHYSFRDVVTGEVLAQYDAYQARGGFMARATRLPAGPQPWTGTYSCVPADEGGIAKRYGFTLVN